MAGTWELEITVLDVDRKEARVTATRTDGTDIQTFVVASAVLDTAQQKTDVLDNIWSQYQASVTRQAAIDAFTSGLEAAGKANLEAREV